MKLKSILIFSALAAKPVLAVNFVWNSGTADWSDASQWTPSGPPGGGGGNHAFINAGQANITSDVNPLQDIFIRGSGIVNQTAGQNVHSTGSWHFVGDTSGSDAAYNISGGKAETYRWYLGRAGGTGRLNISGTAEVVGSGVDNGNVAMIMGDGAGSKGYVTISGGTANFTGQVQAGNGGGYGKLEQSGGTLSTTNTLMLGNGSGSQGFLSISGGTITANNEVWVGQNSGFGQVDQTGGTVTVTNWLAIGRQSATGVYNLSGGSLSQTTNNHTVLGSLGGTGTIKQTGGTFLAGNDLRLGENTGGNGTFDLTGGTATVNGWVQVGWTGGGSGTLKVGGGTNIGTMAAGYVEIGGGAGGAGNGVVDLLTNGVIQSRLIARNGGGISAKLNLDGGTFKATETNTEFLPGFLPGEIEVKVGGFKVDTDGFNITTATPLPGAGGLNKLGAGTLTLAGANTYTGGTTITAGTLNLTGSVVSSVTAGTTTTLTGTGSIAGSLTSTGATISPGAAGSGDVGSLTIGGTVSLDSNSIVTLNINDEAPGSFDQILNTGTFSANNAALTGSFTDTSFNTVYSPATLATATRYTFVTGPIDSSIWGNSTAISAGEIAALGLPGDAREVSISGQRFYVEKGSWALVPIPEPGSLSLAGLSLLVLARRRRR